MGIGTIIVFSSLVVILTTTALTPLLGINLQVYDLSISDEAVATNFLAIRSATFASLAFFIVNYLRNKRPLSSVAPLLAFCNFLVFFGAAIMVKRAQFEAIPWLVLCLCVALSVFLYRENKAQIGVIFRDSW